MWASMKVLQFVCRAFILPERSIGDCDIALILYLHLGSALRHAECTVLYAIDYKGTYAL